MILEPKKIKYVIGFRVHHNSICKASLWLDGKESACNARDTASTLGWEDYLEKGRQPTPVFWPRESHGQRGLADYSLWGHKETDTTELLTFSLS